MDRREYYTMRKEIIGKHPTFPFSKMVAMGPLLYLSGMVAPSPEANSGENNDIEYQTNWLLNQIKADLDQSGSSIDNIIKISIFLLDIENMQVVNRLCSESLGKIPPAASIIQASAIPSPTALIEIEVIAYRTGYSGD